MTNAPARPRVLLVEDEAMIAADLEEVAVAAGWQVVGPVGSLREAVRAAAAEDLDAALLDVDLSGEASFPVAETLAGRGVPFVFLTGGGPGAIPESLRGGPVLRKPYSRRIVPAALAIVTRGRAVRARPAEAAEEAVPA